MMQQAGDRPRDRAAGARARRPTRARHRSSPTSARRLRRPARRCAAFAKGLRRRHLRPRARPDRAPARRSRRTACRTTRARTRSCTPRTRLVMRRAAERRWCAVPALAAGRRRRRRRGVRRARSAGRSSLKTSRGGYDGRASGSSPTRPACADASRRSPAAACRCSPRSGSTSTASWPRSSPARPHGQAVAYPVVETRPARRHLREVVAPAPGLRRGQRRAGPGDRAADRRRARTSPGMLAVELFDTARRRLLVNELAMRPHNSGHWTHRRRASPRQFENHLRAVLDLPLGSPAPPRAVRRDGQRARRRRPGHVPARTCTAWRATRG